MATQLIPFTCTECGGTSEIELPSIDPMKNYTIREVIENRYVGYGERKIYELMKEGKLKSIKIKNSNDNISRTVFSGAEIIRFITDQQFKN